MNTKVLQRIIQEHEPAADSAAMQDLQRRLTGKEFWMWYNNKGTGKDHQQRYKNSKGNCCFNHIIGLPSKNGKEMPLFDYQRQIFSALFVDSYLNKRPASPEEEKKYDKLMIESELKSSTKKESIKYSHTAAMAQRPRSSFIHLRSVTAPSSRLQKLV